MTVKMRQFGMLLLAVLGYWSILRSPLLYGDDALRVFTHTSIDQGVHGRPAADWLYGLLSGGTFVDMSPLSQILALAFMLAGGLLIARSFAPSDAEENPFASWLSLLFVLLPLHYSLVCYRYDSLGMGGGIFCAGAAFFLLSRKFSWPRMLGAAGLVFLVLALYQPLCSIYICASCVLFAHGVLRENFFNTIKRLGWHLGAALGGAVAYFPVYLHAKNAAAAPFCGLSNHPYLMAHNKMLDIDSFFSGVVENIAMFLKRAGAFLGMDIVSICVGCAGLLALGCLLRFPSSLPRKLCALLGLGAALLACGAVELVLREPIFATRTLTSLCAFILCLLLFSLYNGKGMCIKCVMGLTVVCTLASAGILTALGNALRDQHDFNEKILLQPLTEDFSKLVQSQGHFSFFVPSQWNVPVHHSLAFLKQKYAYIDPASSSLFVTMPLLAMFPLTFDLEKSLNPPDITEYPLIVSRLGYAIYRLSDSCYGVVIHSGYGPKAVQKFQSEI